MPNLDVKSPNIAEFAEQLRYSGVSRQSRYFVEMGLPNVVSGNFSANDVLLICLFVQQTQFPEFVVATQQMRAFSNPIEMPYDRIFGPVTMSFLCDAEMRVKSYFDTWCQGIYNSFGGVLNYYEDYVVPEINIYKQDEQNNRVYCVTLYNAYPKVVNDVILSSESSQLSQFQVVFAYEQWKSYIIEGAGYDETMSYLSQYGYGDVMGSMPSIPGIDILTKVTGISSGLDIINKMKNPGLIRDSIRRSSRSVGFEILKGTKANILKELPKSIRQIGGSVISVAGGALGL